MASNSQAFQAKLAPYGRVCSMGRRGHGWDHAPTESWCNSFENERVRGERCATRDAMKATAFAYLAVFDNRKCLHATRGYASSAPFPKDGINPRQGEKQVA